MKTFYDRQMQKTDKMYTDYRQIQIQTTNQHTKLKILAYAIMHRTLY